MILHELSWHKEKYSPQKTRQKAHYLLINIFSQVIRRYLSIRALNFRNRLLLRIVGTNNSFNFNAGGTMGELDDLGGPCQCFVLKRAWFGQYTKELTSVYEESTNVFVTISLRASRIKLLVSAVTFLLDNLK